MDHVNYDEGPLLTNNKPAKLSLRASPLLLLAGACCRFRSDPLTNEAELFGAPDGRYGLISAQQPWVTQRTLVPSIFRPLRRWR